MNIVKNQDKTLLLECEGKYYRLPIREWRHRLDLHRELVARMYYMRFGDDATAEAWLAAYTVLMAQPAADTQLFV